MRLLNLNTVYTIQGDMPRGLWGNFVYLYYTTVVLRVKVCHNNDTSRQGSAAPSVAGLGLAWQGKVRCDVPAL
jgi:hypothetical protein